MYKLYSLQALCTSIYSDHQQAAEPLHGRRYAGTRFCWEKTTPALQRLKIKAQQSLRGGEQRWTRRRMLQPGRGGVLITVQNCVIMFYSSEPSPNPTVRKQKERTAHSVTEMTCAKTCCTETGNKTGRFIVLKTRMCSYIQQTYMQPDLGTHTHVCTKHILTHTR